MAKNKGRKKEFLTLALVSVIIIVAVFVLAPSDTSGRATTTTPSSTGVTWICSWSGTRYEWVPNNGAQAIPAYIGPENQYVNCADERWSCTAGNRCTRDFEGQTCECGEQLMYSRPGSSN